PASCRSSSRWRASVRGCRGTGSSRSQPSSRRPRPASRSWPPSSSRSCPSWPPLLLLRPGLRLLLRFPRLDLQRLRLFLHLRHRPLVRHLQELPLDGRGLLARDLADRGRDLLDVELEDAAPLRLVVGGLPLSYEGCELAAALLGGELDLLEDVRVVRDCLL